MSARHFELPETFLKVVRYDQEYSILLLEGQGLMFFPA
jgi:hypothetical protein